MIQARLHIEWPIDMKWINFRVTIEWDYCMGVN